MNVVSLEKNGSLKFRRKNIEAPKDDECQIEIKAAGVCSSDIYRGFENGAYHYPLIMGHEFSGVVKIKGGPNNNFKEGDRVAIFPLIPCRQCKMCEDKNYAQCKNYKYYGSRNDGGHAQLANIKSWNLLKLPPQVSFEQGAALEPVATVINALAKIGHIRASNIAILGAGFLGLIAAKYLLHQKKGHKITILDRNQFKLNLLKDLDIETLLLKTPQQWSDYCQQNASQFEAVLESCGAPITFENSLQLVAPKGHVVWMGNISGDLQLPQKLVSSILRKEAQIYGTWNSRYDGEGPSDWTKAVDLFSAGLSIDEFITRKIALEDLPKHLQDLHDNKMRVKQHDIIKVMITNFGGDYDN